MVVTTRRVVLHGEVQGRGIRPALARLAARRGWSGSVRNTPHGVELIVRGRLPADHEWGTVLSGCLPVSVQIDHLSLETVYDDIPPGFYIADSTLDGPVAAQIPRDRAICRECLQELREPSNRRFGYPFVTCAACGPRYSLLTAMPFDRERTTMRAFSLCEECRREYADPCDRRFHAQTISCPRCGPSLWLDEGRQILRNESQTLWQAAADALRAGRIVALRGVGGYQLLVDANSPVAVRRLRERKQRSAKPFAVLCRDLAAARRLAQVGPVEAEQLESANNPIVLVKQRFPSELAAEANPGVNDVGLMLPSTAMHELLLAEFGRPVVCTSGNVEGEPLAFLIEDAEQRLAEIADVFLHHDREIQHPIDDSVIRVMAGRPVTIRAARGLAPVPLEVPQRPAHDCFSLACGGHQKSAIALSNGISAVLGPHVGDLDSLAGQQRWDERTRSLSRLIHDSRPLHEAQGVCDFHPRYFPTVWTRELARRPHGVWHHHAHIVTGMLEHGWLDREVLGVAWDGTGLGPDGTIWGGEFLRSTSTSFDRVAHLRPFALPGGEAGMADVRRTALSVLTQLSDVDPQVMAEVLMLSDREVHRLMIALNSAHSPTTTSCGRLFDAAACLILNQSKSAYEGHAALCLESACDNSTAETYLFPVVDGRPLQIDWRPAFCSILADRRAQVPRGDMAMKFHRGLALAIIDVAQRYSSLPVVLGGGVFQNRVLVESIVEQWHNDDQPLALPGGLPPNDGGLAAGQLAAAAMSSATCEELTNVPGSSRTAGRLDRPRSLAGQSGD